MSLTGRPSRPPLALTSSSQILKASSPVLPTTANGPVNSMLKPILIGSTARAAGAAPPTKSAAASSACDRFLILRLPDLCPRRIVVPLEYSHLDESVGHSDRP